jgi:hypothetical protein
VIRIQIQKASLGTPSFLAKGGFGEVFRVDGFLLPGDQAPLAYKEFTSAHAEQARSAETAVNFRAGLSQEDRDELDRYSVWPRALVEDPPGNITGLLMPLIPSEYFCRQADPNSGNLISKPREMSWLIASAAQRSAAQIDIPDLDVVERLILLGQLVYSIGRLHKHGWVFGDLSFKNAVFALDPPRLMLLDCDGAAPLRNTARKQASTPLWDPPECPIIPPPGQRRQQDVQDTITDAYKLGLAILRCLTPGKGAASSRAAARLTGELDAEGTALVTRAVGTDRAARPTAKELYNYLYRLVLARIKPPEILAAKLVKHFVVRGMDARVEWHIENAGKVAVSVGFASPFEVDLTAQPRGCAFQPGESGPVFIEARNRFGVVRMELGELELYDLPPFNVDLNYLPRPQLPAIDAFSLARLREVLEAPTGVRVPEVPPVPSLPTVGLIEALMPGAATVVPLPRFTDTIIEASNAVADIVMSEAKKFAAAQPQANMRSK